MEKNKYHLQQAQEVDARGPHDCPTLYHLGRLLPGSTSWYWSDRVNVPCVGREPSQRGVEGSMASNDQKC